MKLKKMIPILVFSILQYITSIAAVLVDSNFIEKAITLHTATGDIFGTITTPKKFSVIPVALIIAGSGPTDRNGNNPMMKNDGLKELARGLANAGIASLRFDKRGIAESMNAAKEADLRFENYISDAEAWVNLLRKDKRFNKITIIGHSEGSLIGMVAGARADKFISIAGAGQPADVILKEQLIAQPAEFKDMTYPIIDSLKAGKLVENVNPSLAALFRKSVQPYMISWFKYDPQEEIKKLKIPVLIVQGSNDLQVREDDAELLARAYPSAKLVLVANMNHVLKIVDGDKDANIKAYNDPSLPISSKLLAAVINFIKM